MIPEQVPEPSCGAAPGALLVNYQRISGESGIGCRAVDPFEFDDHAEMVGQECPVTGEITDHGD